LISDRNMTDYVGERCILIVNLIKKSKEPD